ncbi:hypothetical protein FH972_023312 [Carpinus fangiana]|uniref:Uncharacterized protein n=1 Tax=Carpinus fangiana TaxID=176857 RepID=A0A5N6KVG7_9ROSI|nr:hypothetical protein FH972_023312 [Carpinus fangiana]
MQKYIDDCNRRIETAQRRLEKTPEEIRQTNALLKEISDLRKTIEAGIQEIAVLIELKCVNIAVMENFKLRATQQIKADKERELKALSDTGGPSGHQKLQVCDVCGAYLSRLDNDRRLADHFYGKMHLGYAQMRKTCETLSKEFQGRPPPVREDYGAPGGGDRGYGDGGWGARGGGYGGRPSRGRGRGRGGYGGGQRW